MWIGDGRGTWLRWDAVTYVSNNPSTGLAFATETKSFWVPSVEHVKIYCEWGAADPNAVDDAMGRIKRLLAA